MGADPNRPLAVDGVLVRAPTGEDFLIDRAAELEEGCVVAVFWDHYFVKLGRLRRPPHPRRHLAIEETVDSKTRVSRQFGLREPDIKAYRVVAVCTPL
jgi:hypothetical protein